MRIISEERFNKMYGNSHAYIDNKYVESANDLYIGDLISWCPPKKKGGHISQWFIHVKRILDDDTIVINHAENKDEELEIPVKEVRLHGKYKLTIIKETLLGHLNKGISPYRGLMSNGENVMLTCEEEKSIVKLLKEGNSVKEIVSLFHQGKVK